MNNKFGKTDPLEGNLCGASAFGHGYTLLVKASTILCKVIYIEF